MIAVAMGRHHYVDAPLPKGQHPPQAIAQHHRVRAAVHQCRAPGGPADEDGIALTHIQEVDMGATVRQACQGRPDQDDPPESGAPKPTSPLRECIGGATGRLPQALHAAGAGGAGHQAGGDGQVEADHGRRRERRAAQARPGHGRHGPHPHDAVVQQRPGQPAGHPPAAGQTRPSPAAARPAPWPAVGPAAPAHWPADSTGRPGQSGARSAVGSRAAPPRWRPSGPAVHSRHGASAGHRRAGPDVPASNVPGRAPPGSAPGWPRKRAGS